MQQFRAGIGARGSEARSRWQALFVAYRGKFPEPAAEIDQMQRRELPVGWDADIPSFEADPDGVATRKASNQVLNAIAPRVPWLLVGSADLTGSTSVGLDSDGVESFEPATRQGRQLHLGIREHESAAISNGMALTKLRPVWSTYLIFSDYARPAIRLSALMELPVIHWFTHDSIGLGEDGPTHQPVEQLASLRAMPGLNVLRPCDANEVAEAWRVMMGQKHQPSALVLTRQNIPVLDRSRYASAEGLRRGGYVLADSGGQPDVILIGTGSEVSLAVDAYEELSAEGVNARVVSLPSWYLFDLQPADYREKVLPAAVQARVAVEQGSTLGWDRYVGPHGQIVGMHTFGASAPLKEVQRKFGFTPERVVEAAREMLE
jgi:transketolase